MTVTVNDGRGGRRRAHSSSPSRLRPSAGRSGGGGSGGGGAFGFLEVLGLLGMGALAARRRASPAACRRSSGHPAGCPLRALGQPRGPPPQGLGKVG